MLFKNTLAVNLQARSPGFLGHSVKISTAAIMCALLMACSSSDDDDEMASSEAASSNGLVSVVSSAGATETLGSIETALGANTAITVVGRVDHQANAVAAGLELGPNEVIFFGNPALGTPLMQQNQLAGIDLPQKLHAYENSDGEVLLSYNSASYLQERHGIAEDTEQLTTIANALQGFAENASGASIDESEVATASVEAGEGIIVVQSLQSFDETYTSLIAAITDTGTLGVFREIDHGTNAAGAGLELPPTRLVIFGNPQVGTPLMVSQPSSGIDLPLKVLVYENADQNVFVAYNDPMFIASRHAISDQTDLVNTIGMNVGGLVAAATGTTANQ